MLLEKQSVSIIIRNPVQGAYMICKRTFKAGLFLFIAACISESTIIHHRDTLHILSNYGREVSFTKSGTFKIDSISPGGYTYPCSLSHSGIFFVTLGGFYVCPCCPSWSIGSSRACYTQRYVTKINFNVPLVLSDTNLFRKYDTLRSAYSCDLPKLHGTSTGSNIFIFTENSQASRPRYVVVVVDTLYLDRTKPTIIGGGSLGYPLETCKNMLVVDMYLQTDGTTNFREAFHTGINDRAGRRVAAAKMSEPLSGIQYVTLQGRTMPSLMHKKPASFPQGCYFLKNGNVLKKKVLINP